jgi:thioredoxin
MKNILIFTALIILFGCNTRKNSIEKSLGTESGGIAVNLTEQAFKDKVFNYVKYNDWKYEGDRPAIIDFYADWCAPCRELSPLLEEVVEEYGNKIILYKVDTEQENNLAQRLGIEALPTLLFIPLTGKPQVSIGLVTKDVLKQSINGLLLNDSVTLK